MLRVTDEYSRFNRFSGKILVINSKLVVEPGGLRFYQITWYEAFLLDLVHDSVGLLVRVLPCSISLIDPHILFHLLILALEPGSDISRSLLMEYARCVSAGNAEMRRLW